MSDLPAVYMPSCTYNILPPQVLIRYMKENGFEVEYFKHDNQVHIFRYCLSTTSNKVTRWREITISIGTNQLFTLRTNTMVVQIL